MNESKNEAGDSRHSASTYELVISGNSFDDRMVLDGDDYLIGRAVEAEIQLVSPSVSRRHARIFRHDDAWFIEDLGSRHGTEIGGVALEPNRPIGLECDSTDFRAVPGTEILDEPGIVMSKDSGMPP